MKTGSRGKMIHPICWAMVLSFALVGMPSLARAGQPQSPVVCTEQPDPITMTWGEYTDCTIDSGTDVDQFTFCASAAEVGKIAKVSIVATGGYGFYEYIEVWDPSGTKIIDTINNLFTVDLTLVEGCYRIALSSSSGVYAGSYHLEFHWIRPPYDPDPTISYDCPINDHLQHGMDDEYLIFNGIQSSTVRIKTTATGGYGFYVCTDVWAPSGAKIVDRVCNQTLSVDKALTETGEYLVAFSSNDRVYAGSYVFEVNCMAGTCPTAPVPEHGQACSDGVDDDCDGLVDAQDPDCSCTDNDGDGYGNPASATCPHPEEDCDDSDPDVNPGAAEICTGGIDEDCDDLIDSADPDCKGGYSGAANAEASIYGPRSLTASGSFNALALLLIPVGAVIVLRILRRRK